MISNLQAYWISWSNKRDFIIFYIILYSNKRSFSWVRSLSMSISTQMGSFVFQSFMMVRDLTIRRILFKYFRMECCFDCFFNMPLDPFYAFFRPKKSKIWIEISLNSLNFIFLGQTIQWCWILQKISRKRT